ncbi:DUF1622 domain-containing protein [Thiohalophilus sp.]|uniref:DUF1622 domain-containing protein n=1 Tax=Thiohalophilus sp. TaxID=3028392 RepID=UPI0039765719
MSEIVKRVAEWSVLLIETLGIAIITLVAMYALVQAVRRLVKETEREPIFQELRQRVGSGILLGLEFLIAADIIHTVAVDLTFYSVGVLAVVVLIRTFLSFTLEVELTGRWPWQEKA